MTPAYRPLESSPTRRRPDAEANPRWQCWRSHRHLDSSYCNCYTLTRRPNRTAISKETRSMSKQEEAGLILKLYELRREETMRKARDWFFLDFNPETLPDFNSTIFCAHSGHCMKGLAYWDKAAALVTDGAIRPELFGDCNGGHIGVFSKIELLPPEIRAAHAPKCAASLEKLIDATPDGRKRSAMARERM